MIAANLSFQCIPLHLPERCNSFQALTDRDKILRVIVDAKHLEASTETIFQYLLQLFVLLVGRNSLKTTVNEGFG